MERGRRRVNTLVVAKTIPGEGGGGGNTRGNWVKGDKKVGIAAESQDSGKKGTKKDR